jgi:hypothetical protein
VVEKANHTAAQRWWRTLADETSPEQAQASLDRWCALRGDTRLRPTGDGGGGDGGGDEPIDLSATYEVGRSFALASVRKRGLPFRIECNTACTARADLFIPAKVAKQLGISARRQVKIGTGSAQLTAAGSRAGKVKLTKKAAKRLRRTRRLTATLTIVIKDAAGVATAPVSVRVKLGG